MESNKVPGQSTSSPKAPRPFSLRLRLAVLATLVLVLSLGLVGVALDAAHRASAVSSLQSRMESNVYLVLAAMEVDAGGNLSVEEPADPRLAQPGSGLYLQVDGRREQWRSRSTIGVPLPPPQFVETGGVHFEEPARGESFFAYRFGVGWELPDASIEPFTIAVLVDSGELLRETAAFRLGLWRSLLATGLILALAQALILYLVFRPLGLVARDVARVESGRASRLEGDYPAELEPLARNVNHLLATEKSNRQRIRNALDSLAHSLKTPLAVIQAGLPLHGGDSSASMQNAADEMNHLIATRLERAGTSARRSLGEPVPLAEQLDRIIESLGKVYSHKLIEPEVILEPDLAFYGEQRDLLELLGNLLDNAFKYGNEKIRVSAGAVGPDSTRPGLWLCVEDDGPGIAAAQRARLLQRGTRGDEHVEGHGLGLAIVMELVTAYGGEVSIGDSNMGGVKIKISIPAT